MSAIAMIIDKESETGVCRGQGWVVKKHREVHTEEERKNRLSESGIWGPVPQLTS